MSESLREESLRLRVEDGFIEKALEIVRLRLTNDAVVWTESKQVMEFLTLFIGKEKEEVFAVLFMDTQNRLIEAEIMFRGSVDQCAVYPRNIAERALHHKATGVVLAHNHPSGTAEASASDIEITRDVKQALDTLRIRTLDHIIVGATCLSFSDADLL